MKNFTPVSGQEVLDRIYDREHNELYAEEVIEDVYKMLAFKASNGNVWTTKRSFYKSLEQTDGYMEFTFKKYTFYAIMEVKRKVCNTENQYKKQLLQALRYLWLYKNDKSIKFFILASEKFYIYVDRRDIEDLIEELSPLFAVSTKSACKSWQDPALKEVMQRYFINFHVTLIDQLRLDNTLKEIYKLAA